MPHFSYETLLPVGLEEAWAWHLQPQAFDLLVPPWECVEVLEKTGEPFCNGSTVVLRQRLFPGVFSTWHLELFDCHAPNGKTAQFADRLQKGPFRFWEHRHIFEAIDGSKTRLRDEIDYQLPLPSFLQASVFQAIIQPVVALKFRQLFGYRARVLAKIAA